MRIAYLVESTELSGEVKVVLLQAEALARRGHRVTVVSRDPDPPWFSFSRARFERASFRESKELSQADVRVATSWTTVAPAVDGARIPVFHLCQGYEGASSASANSHREIEGAYRAPTRKLAISASLAQRLEDLGFGPVEEVGPAFDPAGFFPASQISVKETPTVLLVGTSEADARGIDPAIEGLRLWRERGGRFRVRHVSTRPAGDEERTSGSVDEYHHAVPPDRMPFVYRASDVFVGPARSGGGVGLPTLEALACGLPCVLANTAGNVEIAGEAAWYFRDGEPESLAQTLPSATTPSARTRARESGPQLVGRFDPPRVAQRLEALFRVSLDGAA